jgi:predicted MFS family arabinose efflux permease
VEKLDHTPPQTARLIAQQSNFRILLICFGLSLIPAIGLGFGRFAYALILPAMKSDLAWSFAEAGSLNSANAFGHLMGALVAVVVISSLGNVRTIVACTALTTCAIGATPIFASHDYLLLMRFLAGLTGAIAFVAGGALATQAASVLNERAAFGVGLYYAGPGVGILCSALLVTPFVAVNVANWPAAWYAMAAAAAVMGIVVVAASVAAPNQPSISSSIGRDLSVTLWPALAGYGLFAAGYVGYITFIIANVQERGGSLIDSAYWWACLGLGGIVAVAIWSNLIRRSVNGLALAILIGLTGVASAVPLLLPTPLGFLISFCLFGATFLAVVAATTNLVRVARPPESWAKWIALFTLVFGIGQTIGPFVTGMVADMIGSTDGVLWVSAGLLFVGAALSWAQRNVR